MKHLTSNFYFKFLCVCLFVLVSTPDSSAISEENNDTVIGYEDRVYSNNLAADKQAVDIDSQDFVVSINFLAAGTSSIAGTDQWEQVAIMLKPIMGGAKDNNQFLFRNLCQDSNGVETPANIEIAGISTDANGDYCSNAFAGDPDYGHFQYDSNNNFTGSDVIFENLTHAFVNCSQRDFVNVLSNPRCHGRLVQIQINCGGTCNGNPNTNRRECENPTPASGYTAGTWIPNFIEGDTSGNLAIERMFFLKKDASFAGLNIDTSTTINNKSNLTVYPRNAVFSLEGDNWYNAYDLSTQIDGNPMQNGAGNPCHWDTGVNIDSKCIQELNDIYYEPSPAGDTFKVVGNYNDDITYADAHPPNVDMNGFSTNHSGPAFPTTNHFGVWVDLLTPYMGSPDGITMYDYCEGINGTNVPSDF